uniref:Uncharacterized protein n=1 Tax=Cacopsylla melanoneura TaxID=428564 RepID=A0A8D9BQH3_9HEMI
MLAKGIRTTYLNILGFLIGNSDFFLKHESKRSHPFLHFIGTVPTIIGAFLIVLRISPILTTIIAFSSPVTSFKRSRIFSIHSFISLHHCPIVSTLQHLKMYSSLICLYSNRYFFVVDISAVVPAVSLKNPK